MIPDDLQFNWPGAFFLLLLLIPILLFWWMLGRHRLKIIEQYSKKPALESLMEPRSSLLSQMRLLAFAACWILVCMALAGPNGNIHYIAAPSSEMQRDKVKMQNIIFLIDTSASMQVTDANHNTRLEMAKEVAEQTMNQLQGFQVGLYAFTSDLISLAPLTLDHLFVRLSLKEIQMNEGGTEGTNLSAVLTDLKNKLLELPKHSFIVILLSDGGDNSIEKLTGQARQKAIEQLSQLFPSDPTGNLHLLTVGIGSKEGGSVPNILINRSAVHSKLEEEILKNLGQGYFAMDGETSDQLAQELVRAVKTVPSGEANLLPKSAEEGLLSDLYFQFPLGLAIIMLGIAIFLPQKERGIR